MIVTLRNSLSAHAENIFIESLKHLQAQYLRKKLYGKDLILIFNSDTQAIAKALSDNPSVERIDYSGKQYRLASSAWKPERTVIDIKGVKIGAGDVVTIAGPCSVESEEQIFSIAKMLSELGVQFIRGGAYKPRTSPYSFQGLGREGLRLIKSAADAYNLRVVTEIIDSSMIDEISEYADILQVGSRNMQNFFFLKQLGKVNKPILLKRGMYARIDEWLMAAEYILSEGNEEVILCERGIRTFDTSVRNTFDLAAIPLIHKLSHLPILADPSHGTGDRSLVPQMGLASVAAGADGVIVEVHPDPSRALSDGAQSLYPEQFREMYSGMKRVGEAIGRKVV